MVGFSTEKVCRCPLGEDTKFCIKDLLCGMCGFGRSLFRRFEFLFLGIAKGLIKNQTQMFNKILKKVNKETKFWEWFSKNEKKYFNLESDQEVLFDELNLQLNKLDENLTFEFSPVLDSGRREFIISADGIISSFPAVVKLTEAAPSFENWIIVAFRQPHLDYSQVDYKDISLDFEDVYFRYSKDNGKIGLELNIRGYKENDDWGVISYLLLDNILGEYDVEMGLSWIERKELNEAEVENLYNITELPLILSEYKLEFQN